MLVESLSFGGVIWLTLPHTGISWLTLSKTGVGWVIKLTYIDLVITRGYQVARSRVSNLNIPYFARFKKSLPITAFFSSAHKENERK